MISRTVVVEFYNMFKGHFGAKAVFNENFLPSTVYIAEEANLIYERCQEHLF